MIPDELKQHAKGLNHVAIAVNDLETKIEFYRDVLGLSLSEIEEVPDQKVKTAIFGEGLGRVELLWPTSDDSPISGFLRKRGEGLHHICVEVGDIEAAMAALRASGAKLIDEKPKVGAGGCKIAFVHPKSTGGVLIELSQSV